MIKKLAFILGLVFFTTVYGQQTVLIVGNSLSEGFGTSQQKNWVKLLAEKLSPLHWQVINISKSGETTQQGLNKLNPALAHYQPNMVIVELGTNDGIKGLPSKEIITNLTLMADLCQKTGAKLVVLRGQLPAAYHEQDQQIQQAYNIFAASHDDVTVIEFLKGIINEPKLMHVDNIHPNDNAQVKMFLNVWQPLKDEFSSSTEN